LPKPSGGRTRLRDSAARNQIEDRRCATRCDTAKLGNCPPARKDFL